MALLKFFDYSVRVFYKDTDAGGVVYHTRYAEFMEMARSEMLREADISVNDLIINYDIVCPVIEMNLKYKKSAKYDDLLTIHIDVQGITATRLELYYEIFNQEKELLVTANTINCAVKGATFKVTKFPKEFMSQFYSNK